MPVRAAQPGGLERRVGRTYLGAMSKLLIVLGITLVVLGLAWPLLARLGLGHLPGDFHLGGEGWSVHVLLGTSILVSIVVTVLLNLLLWWLGR